MNRSKKQNILEANLRLELKSNPDDYEFFKIFTESCEDVGIDYRQHITESKQPINEAIATTIISGALASGKLIDLIGSFLRRAYNWILKRAAMGNKTCKPLKGDERKRCAEAAIKGKKMESSWIEKAGEWIQSTIIMGFFKVIAVAIVGILGPFVVGFDKSLDVIKDGGVIEKLANTLFYASITIIGIQGITHLVHAAHAGNLSHYPEIVEQMAVGTKIYELILLIISLFLHKKFSKGVVELSHTLGQCIGADGKLGKLFKTLKDKEHWGEIHSCLAEGHH